MSTFAVIDEEVVLRTVQQCRMRLVCIALVTIEPLVSAMTTLMARQALPSVTAIVDRKPS